MLLARVACASSPLGACSLFMRTRAAWHSNVREATTFYCVCGGPARTREQREVQRARTMLEAQECAEVLRRVRERFDSFFAYRVVELFAPFAATNRIECSWIITEKEATPP